MKNLNPNYINYKSFKEKSGSLIPFYTNKSFPKFFKLKRFFFLYGKKKYLRADHAHTKCDQILLPIKGRIEVITYKKGVKKKFILNEKKSKGIIIPTRTWLKIKFYKDNDCLLTLCNYKYDKKEYILSFDDFLKNYY
jgi:hypothetical protein